MFVCPNLTYNTNLGLKINHGVTIEMILLQVVWTSIIMDIHRVDFVTGSEGKYNHGDTIKMIVLQVVRPSINHEDTIEMILL